jgi:hypothetical protein
MTVEQAAAFVGGAAMRTGSAVLQSAEEFSMIYRTAAKRFHPDVAPGESKNWTILQEAAGLLKRHFGIA